MRPYEISIKKYNALGVMGSLNRIGLSWYHPGLYTSMMRDEWGWMGYLVTDGDGSNGDAYNNTAALLYCAQGAMLGSNGNMSVANASTIAAYGTNYKDTKYGQWLLQKVMLYYTYQYANNDMQAGTPSNTWKVYWYVGDAVLVAGIAAILVVGVIVPLKKKKNPIVK
jgi:beta-glucosidase